MMNDHPSGQPGPPAARLMRGSDALPIAAMILIFMAAVGSSTFADPDMFHEMALWREARALGHLPAGDSFAYTPTVDRVVHHEWATGAVLYELVACFGEGSLLVVRYTIALLLAWGVFALARRRGAQGPILWLTIPIAAYLVSTGLTTVRAQVFTLLFTMVLLWCFELDREGRRWWIGPWLIIFILWLNLHGGFVLAGALLGVWGVEKIIRREPWLHLFGLGVMMVALIAVNPYGLDYYPYIIYAVLLDRPLIGEWRSIWTTGPIFIGLFIITLVLALYAVLRREPGGWRSIRGFIGLLLVIAAAVATMRSQRHVSIYAILWVAYVPAALSATPLAAIARRVFEARPRVTAGVFAAFAVAAGAGFMWNRPWEIVVPVYEDEPPKLVYPVGVMEYLRETGFQGNVMTPFTSGAYLSWHLYPDVKVSMDGRYEVAYQPGVLEEHYQFWKAREGWEAFLDKYPNDLVLIRSADAVAEKLADHAGWRRVYRDDTFELYAREDRELPEVDRCGEPIPRILFDFERTGRRGWSPDNQRSSGPR